jgi:hypothetical protein
MANKNMGLYILIAVVAAYLLVPQVNTAVNNLFAGIGEQPTTIIQGETPAPGAPEICIYDGTTMTIGPMKKKYAPSTSVSGETARLYINDVDEGLKNDSSQVSVTYGDRIKIAYAVASSTYYAAVDEFTVPCKATISTASSLVAGADKPHELYQQNAGLTSNINNEDNSVNSAANRQAIGAGDNDIEVEVSLKGTYEDGWSPYGKLIASCQYNGSEIDEVKLGSFSSASCPSVTTDALTNVANDRQCFELPGMDGVENKKEEFTMIIDADDTVDPANATNIVCTVYDQDYYVNSDTNEVEGPAVEDNDDANVGITSDLSFTVYIE